MKFLWLDDERSIPPKLKNKNVYWAKSYDEAVNYISNNKNLFETNFIVDLDHDLAEDKTGYDFAKWLIEHNITGFFHIHSMNPVGASNIRQLLTHYGWIEKFF